MDATTICLCCFPYSKICEKFLSIIWLFCFVLCYRRLSGTIDVIGQTITISRVEGRRRANENSNIQVPYCGFMHPLTDQEKAFPSFIPTSDLKSLYCIE